MVALTPEFYNSVAAVREDHVNAFRGDILAKLGTGGYPEFKESWFLGCASRILGDDDTATEYFRYAVQLRWSRETGEAKGSLHKAGIALCQAAVMAGLAGDHDRAKRRFQWAVANFNAAPQDEYAAWKPGLEWSSSSYGDIMLYWAYAEARVGHWEQVAHRCAQAVASYEEAMKARTFRSRSLLALARTLPILQVYVADPTRERLRRVSRALDEIVHKETNLRGHVEACAFVWDLEWAFLTNIASTIPRRDTEA